MSKPFIIFNMTSIHIPFLTIIPEAPAAHNKTTIPVGILPAALSEKFLPCHPFIKFRLKFTVRFQVLDKAIDMAVKFIVMCYEPVIIYSGK